MRIENAFKLTSQGCRLARQLVLDLLEHGLRAADPYGPVARLLRVEEDGLSVGGRPIPLEQGGRVFVLGAGKASLRVAKALEDRLGDRISDGLVVVKRGQTSDLSIIRTLEASHPLPDSSSVTAAQQLMAMAAAATEKDLVLTAITGGSSSLLCLPPQGVSLKEKRELHRALLLSGASIHEVNAVRKHVSGIKGGRLAQAAMPAVVLNFTVSDVVGDQLDCVAGPVVADTSTLQDAIGVLHRYGLYEGLPESIHGVLANDAMETPKRLNPDRVQMAYMMSLDAACNGAQARALELGCHVQILSDRIEGESRDVGQAFGDALSQFAKEHHRLKGPHVLLACGEMTVTMPQGGGEGGPNQEAALSAVASLDGLTDAAVAFLGTDGTDGPTSYAGGLVDAKSAGQAASEGLILAEAIAGHDATPALVKLSSAIKTGHTGTNVADLLIGVAI